MSADPQSAPIEIEVRNLSKWFGKTQVLRSVSVQVRRGQAVAIIGPSGSGKTTLLRCVNFLEEYQEGEVMVGGQPVGYSTTAGGKRRRQSARQIAAMRARLGMVFQSFNLFPHKTVLENVALGPLRVRGMPKDEAFALSESFLDRVGLSAKSGAYPGQLSGGQQQRVAIARALAMEPSAMLFDEVTSALDPELVGEVLDVMQQLVKDGMTMMIVTHEMAFARAFAHDVVFMASGEVVEAGPPASVFEDPQSERLTTFLKRFREGYRI